MEPRKVTYDDLSGGLNEGAPAGAIADNEMTVLDNFYPFGKKLIRRGGSFPLSNSAYNELLTAVMTYRPENVYGSRELNADWTIFGTLTGLARMLPGASTGAASATGSRNSPPPPAGTVEPLSGPRFTADYAPWDMLQYKSVGYAMRRGAGLVRFDHKRYSVAGIERPSSAPTLTDSGAGVLTAATYKGVVVFANSTSGALSNPSDPGTVTVAASRWIGWSNIPVSTNPQVDVKFLFRTLPDAQGVYLFVGEIPNATTTFTDNVAIADMGDFVEFDNDLPPGLVMGDTWQERLFGSDGSDLVYSEPFLPESFGLDSRILIFKDDGHPITAVHAADKNKLIVAKHKGIHFLTPAGNGWALDTLDKSAMCVSNLCMKSVAGQLLWFGGTTFYRSLGGPAEDIASVKLKRTLEHVDPERYPYAVSAIFPRWGWYITALRVDNGYSDPTGDRSRQHMNNVMLCYNYVSGAWCKFTCAEGGPVWIGEGFDARGKEILQTLMYDRKLYEFDRGGSDGGLAISARARTKAFRWQQNGLLHAIRRFWLLSQGSLPTSSRSPATYRLYKNQSTTAAKERVLTLDTPTGAEGWRGANLSTLTNPGSEWQWEIEYTGAQPIEFEALALEVVPLARAGVVR